MKYSDYNLQGIINQYYYCYVVHFPAIFILTINDPPPRSLFFH